jgi:hypothetical protein
MFSTCATCDIKCCNERVNDGIKGCGNYYNKNINTLEGTMNLNENFDKLGKVAHRAPYSEVKDIEKWSRDCTKQWLKGFKAEIEQFPTVDDLSIECRDVQLELINTLIERVNKKENTTP